MTPEQTIQQLVDPPQTNIKSSTTRSAASTRRSRTSASSPRRSSRAAASSTRRQRGARLGDLREPPEAEGRLEARPERDDVHRRRARQAAARRPDRRRLRPAREAPEAREPEGPRRTSCSCAPTTASSVAAVQKEIQTAYPNAQVASAKQVADQISGSLVDAVEPLAPARHRARVARRARRVPARRAADALVGRQARPRDRDAEGARLDAARSSSGRSSASRSRRASLGGLLGVALGSPSPPRSAPSGRR